MGSNVDPLLHRTGKVQGNDVLCVRVLLELVGVVRATLRDPLDAIAQRFELFVRLPGDPRLSSFGQNAVAVGGEIGLVEQVAREEAGVGLVLSGQADAACDDLAQ